MGSKRLLQIPVICYPSGSKCEPQEWIFGKTLAVGSGGLRIRSASTCSLALRIELDLLILNNEEQSFPQEEDVPACIKVQVSWIDIKKQIFEVKYLA